jgi:hypothetical protein
MKEFREPKDSDHENVEKCLDMLMELRELNDHIESNIWLAAYLSLVVTTHVVSGDSYRDFCKEMERGMKFYKSSFNK